MQVFTHILLKPLLLMLVKQLKPTIRSFGLGELHISKGKQEFGFAIKTSLVPKLIGKPKAINDRLMTAQFPLTKNAVLH